MISIIIPTLNEEVFIGEMLARLREKLTEHEFEIIVSDNGSWDDTVKIAKRYATVLEHNDVGRKTIAWQRNQGAKIARGEFFVFLDAGVHIPEPNKFFRLALQRFETDSKLVGLAPKIRISHESETLTDAFFGSLLNFFWWFENNILGIGIAPGKCQIIKASAFQTVRGYREDLVAAEDADIFARLAKRGRTRVDLGLTVYHSGRRVHTLGWTKLLWTWFKNFFAYTFFGRSITKDWYIYPHIQKDSKSAKKLKDFNRL